MRWLNVGLFALAAGCASVEEPDIVAQGGGVVRVSCAADEDGELHDCRILSERPTGLGLGDAALRAAEKSRVNTDVLRAWPPGARVEYNVRFRPENMPRP
jgi:TonB family protein